MSPPSSCTVGRIRESNSSLIIITVSSSSSLISKPKIKDRKQVSVPLTLLTQKWMISCVSFTYVIHLVSFRAQRVGHSQRSPWRLQRFLASKHSNQPLPFSTLWWSRCQRKHHAHHRHGISALLNKIKQNLINSLTFNCCTNNRLTQWTVVSVFQTGEIHCIALSQHFDSWQKLQTIRIRCFLCLYEHCSKTLEIHGFSSIRQ